MSFFCSAPWEQIVVMSYGQTVRAAPCCMTTNFDNPLYSEYATAPQVQELKNQLLVGEKPKACMRCILAEESSGKSLRTDIYKTSSSYISQINSVESVHVVAGNRCNLTCITCVPTSASGWIKINAALPEKFQQHVDAPISKPGSLYPAVNINFDRVKNLQLSGGETLLDQKELLAFLLSFPNRANINVLISTNGTRILIPELQNLLSEFNHVTYSLSLDGTEAMFEDLRYPAKWNNVEANINWFRELRSRSHKIALLVNCTVSWMNIGITSEFLEWCYSNDLHEVNFSLATCHLPDNLWSATILPPEIKSEISNKMPDHLRAYMNSEDNSHLYNTAVEFITAIRNTRSRNT